jgi:hypothetical protein
MNLRSSTSKPGRLLVKVGEENGFVTSTFDYAIHNERCENTARHDGGSISCLGPKELMRLGVVDWRIMMFFTSQTDLALANRLHRPKFGKWQHCNGHVTDCEYSETVGTRLTRLDPVTSWESRGPDAETPHVTGLESPETRTAPLTRFSVVDVGSNPAIVTLRFQGIRRVYGKICRGDH